MNLISLYKTFDNRLFFNLSLISLIAWVDFIEISSIVSLASIKVSSISILTSVIIISESFKEVITSLKDTRVKSYSGLISAYWISKDASSSCIILLRKDISNSSSEKRSYSTMIFSYGDWNVLNRGPNSLNSSADNSFLKWSENSLIL